MIMLPRTVPSQSINRHSPRLLSNKSAGITGSRCGEVHEIDPVGMGVEILHRVQELAEISAASNGSGSAGFRREMAERYVFWM